MQTITRYNADAICCATLLYYQRTLDNNALTSTEIWEYQIDNNTQPTSLSLQHIRTALYSLVQKNIVVERNGFFSLHKKSFYGVRQQRITHSIDKWFIVQKKIKMISWMPFIRQVDVLGSVAMNNASQSSDLDVCVITSRNTLWSVMLATITLTALLRIKRNRTRVQDQLCFNQYTNNARNPYPEHIGLFFSRIQKQSIAVYVCERVAIKQAIEKMCILSGIIKICENIGHAYFTNKKVAHNSSVRYLWQSFHTPPTHAISYAHKIHCTENRYRTTKHTTRQSLTT